MATVVASRKSTRWIEGYERVAEVAAQLPDTRLVSVADRETDIAARMRCAQELLTPVDWLVRSAHNRSLDGGDKLWSKVLKTKDVGEIQFMMAARVGRKARTVKQVRRMKRVALPCGVAATCVIAKEVDPPVGVKPVEWRFRTNRVPHGHDDLVELVDWYSARWEIEIYFPILKNGCRVEELQLAAVDCTERALALFMIVAWRIAYLMRVGRTCPDLDAVLFFGPDEIHGGHLLIKKRMPEGVERLNAVLRLVAQRGGFFVRTGDDEPGAKIIWQGLERVMKAADTLRGLRHEAA